MPRHHFHHEAWTLMERHRSGRIGNTISTLAFLGTDVDLLSSIEKVFQTLGPDWFFSHLFGGPIDLSDPNYPIKVEHEKVQASQEVWFTLDMSDLVCRGNGWVSAISVYPISAVGNFSIVVNGIPSLQLRALTQQERSVFLSTPMQMEYYRYRPASLRFCQLKRGSRITLPCGSILWIFLDAVGIRPSTCPCWTASTWCRTRNTAVPTLPCPRWTLSRSRGIAKGWSGF